jgi:hypothetical protein
MAKKGGCAMRRDYLDNPKIRAAANRWVSRFNEIPTAVIAKLGNYDLIGSPEEDDEVGELPGRGCVWQFDDGFDMSWIASGEGVKALVKCGFKVYEQEDFEYVFGIDGGGYDLWDCHFIPLYIERGLEWHKTDD